MVIKRVILLFCAAAFLLLAIVLLQSHTLERWIDDIVYDNQGHYLSCDQLPPLEAIERVLTEQAETIRAIEAVHPGNAGVELDTSCPNKGSLVIWYASHQDRKKIEVIINSDTFFGIPYSLNNR